jgi:transcriptional regulator with XRE-family HTH domain
MKLFEVAARRFSVLAVYGEDRVCQVMNKMVSMVRVAEEAREFRVLLDKLRSEPGYWKHFAVLQFTTAMARLMNKPPRVTGRKLAKLLGKTPPTVSKALSGGENLTIGTMAEMAGALDAAVHIHVAPRGVVVTWKEEPMRELHCQPAGPMAEPPAVPAPATFPGSLSPRGSSRPSRRASRVPRQQSSS